MTALAISKRSEIINRLAKGELLRDISASLKVTPGAISQYLSKDDEYKAAREAGTEQQLDQWQKAIQRADDPLKLARAREAFRAVAWRAEREHPGRWGQQQQVGIGQVIINLGVSPRQQLGQVIEVVQGTGVMSNADAVLNDACAQQQIERALPSREAPGGRSDSDPTPASPEAGPIDPVG